MTRHEVIETLRRKGIKPGQLVLKAWFLTEPEAEPVLRLLESLADEGLFERKDWDYILRREV